ncbi:MAG TPA: IclR family transcriptional regulator [Streptosporangiaceae bacterium]
MKNRPPYPLESVDNALRMLHVLRDQGRTSVSEAAAELGIGRSTAHRLLAMLVYRNFAVKDDDRTYRPGPALSAPRLTGRPLRLLRTALQPHMEGLCERAGETVNLVVRVGTQTRFLASVESVQFLHVGDRQGTILPAWRASGGKALLAELADEQVLDLLRRDAGGPGAAITDTERAGLLAELRAIRRRGYAENLEGTEAGVSAVGMCLRQGGSALAALSIAVPTVRYTPATARFLVAELRATIDRIEEDPAFAGPESAESAGR